jgi:hypothetical protein
MSSRSIALALVCVAAIACVLIGIESLLGAKSDAARKADASVLASGSQVEFGSALPSAVLLVSPDLVERTTAPLAAVNQPTVKQTVHPNRPREEGLLPVAPKCMRDPFYNPEEKSLSPNQLGDLQKVIDQLNRELARVSEERSEMLKSEADRRFREGQWVPEEQASRHSSGVNVLYREDRTQVGVGADQAVSGLASHGPRTVIITSGEIPGVDELSDLKRHLAKMNQDTLRDFIADMLAGQ